MARETVGIEFMADYPKPEQATLMTQLIACAREGDAEAFDQLMVYHQHRVVSIAWGILGNREEAHDAAQEAFLRVYKHLSTFDMSRDFSGWLYRIVVNVCHDFARKRRRIDQFISFEREYEESDLSQLPSAYDTEAVVIREQERALVMRALATLSEKERRALVLRDLEGLETDEVAKILGSSPTTVRSQISSARTKIRNFRDQYLKGRRKDH